MLVYVPDITRKQFMTSMLVAAASAALPAGLPNTEAATKEIALEDLKAMERVCGFEFSDEERKSILADVRNLQKGYIELRKEPIDFTTEPSTIFTPLGGGTLPGSKVSARPTRSNAKRAGLSDEDLAYLSVKDLGHLIKTRQITSVEITKLYLARLKKYGGKLLCVITLTEDLALAQAERADKEIAEGRYRGPLHGVPYGIKDLFATKGIPTTWGAEPYQHQVLDFDSTVVKKLEAAGAVLLAKLSMGALAMDDHWFNGKTKNPWNAREGSSGSSAGSASATSAGLVSFSIGTETLGSIVSPSIRCRVTGLRPTYGRVSRYGGMALSYTMDKPGPICREAEDCALVLAAICGSDKKDPSAVDRSFQWPPRVDFSKMKIGWLVQPGAKPVGMDTDPVLEVYRKLGAQIRPVSFKEVPEIVLSILEVESASAFDEFTRGEKIHQLKNSLWPNIFRTNFYVPGVEYLQMQRARTLLMKRFEEEFGDLDFFVCDRDGYTLFHTNLTGHPQLVIPLADGAARSLVGRLYKEDVLVAAGKAAQDALGHHKKRPDLSKL